MVNSFFAQFFMALQAHIKDLVPEIRYIDQDLGQLEWYEVRPAVSWPCVLVDFNATNYDELSGGVQWGNVAFTLRLGFPPYSSANSLAPDAVKEQALKYYELEQALYVALQGWDAGGLAQPVVRTIIATERREEDAFRVRILSFSTAFEDSSAVPVRTKIARPPIDIEFSQELPL